MALDTHDIVLGPCEDGGYYLIGMKKLHYKLFHGIKWSTDEVLRQTIGAADILGLRNYLLPRLIDIDTAEDLSRWKRTATGLKKHRPSKTLGKQSAYNDIYLG